MAVGPYRLLDHTADLGLEIYGRDLADLFANACFALFDNITDLSRVKASVARSLAVTGDDLPDLMVNWLRELLALWTIDGLLVASARVKAVSETRLTAELACDVYAADRHDLKTDIKAVTYHQIAVTREAGGWTARVVMDV
jgi:SHS2 domain-containing protein